MNGSSQALDRIQQRFVLFLIHKLPRIEFLVLNKP